VPGTSLTNAPVVRDGTYALDINPGETQVLAVPLDWGQDVQAQLDARLTPGAVEAGAIGSAIDVQVMGPMRSPGAVSFYGSAPPDWSTAPLANMRSGERFRTGAQSLTVAYTQRAASAQETRGAAVPGLRYISVAYNVRGDDANLPYTLTIRTNDSAGTTAPEYAEVDGLAPPEADSALTGPGSGTGSQDALPRAADPDSDSDSDSDSGPSDGGFPWLVVALVAAGAAGLVVAYVVRRRRVRR
jgi:Ca-activated chloride channel family protein